MLAHKALLDILEKKYNSIAFIEHDPIVVPHAYSTKADIEIAGFISAVFAWGQRITIINKSKLFLSYMDNAPLDFLLNHSEKDLSIFEKFVHRTFNSTDALYFIYFLTKLYRDGYDIEKAFCNTNLFSNPQKISKVELNIEKHLMAFRDNFFSLPDYPLRTRKHISSPAFNTTCKRLCMYLRWMVRKDKNKVDFGIWKSIKANQLICPIDVHVARVAIEFKLIQDLPINWKRAIELTDALKTLDPNDPVKYDFALFGFGLESKANQSR